MPKNKKRTDNGLKTATESDVYTPGSNFTWGVLIGMIASAIILTAWYSPPPLYQIYKLLNPMNGAQDYPSSFYINNPYDMKTPGFSFWDWCHLSILYVLVMIFGRELFRRFWTDLIPGNFVARHVGAFFVGYLSVVGVARLLSFIVDSRHIHLYMITLIFLLWAVNMMRARNAGTPKYSYGKNALWSVLGGAFVISALLIQIFQYDFTWHSHFGLPLSEMQYQVTVLKKSFFPLIFNYYDSVLFHYVMTYPLADKIHTIIPWWITLALIKLSAFVFLYHVFRTLGASCLLSLASTLFLFFGTISPVVTKYYLLFDYGNPMFYESDISRIVAFSVCMLVLFSSARAEKIPGNFIMVIVFSIAMTSLVASHLAWIVVVLTFAWVFGGDSDITRPLSAFLDQLICFSVVVAWTLLFMLPFTDYYVARLVVCVIPVVAWCVRYFAHSGYLKLRLTKKELPAMAAIVSIAFGLLFLGNIFLKNPLADTLYKSYGQSLLFFGTEKLNALYAGNYGLGDFRDMDRVMAHAQFALGPVGFFCFYGGILIMILLSSYFSHCSWKKTRPERTWKILHEFFLLSVIPLPLLFFFMNFINIGEHAWYKIRFTQIPIIYIQFYFLFSLSRLEVMRRKTAGMIVVAALLSCCLIPFVATRRPEQMYENFHVMKAVFFNDNRTVKTIPD